MAKVKITKIKYGEQLTSIKGEPWKCEIEIADRPGVSISGLIWNKDWANVGDVKDLVLTNDDKYGPQFRIANKTAQLEQRITDLEYKLERHLTECKLKTNKNEIPL